MTLKVFKFVNALSIILTALTLFFAVAATRALYACMAHDLDLTVKLNEGLTYWDGAWYLLYTCVGCLIASLLSWSVRNHLRARLEMQEAEQVSETEIYVTGYDFSLPAVDSSRGPLAASGGDVWVPVTQYTARPGFPN